MHLSDWMKLRCLLLVLAVLLFAQFRTAAQFVFSSLFPRDGLSSKEVFCSYVDAEGFLWCGTSNGLNRWDGSRFQTITPFSKSFPGLVDERIYAITEWNNKLWVGTERGVSCLDKRSRHFTTIPFAKLRDTSRGNGIHSLISDGSHLWAGTWRGLYFLDNGKWSRASKLSGAAAALDTTSCIVYPTHGTALWIRTDSMLYYLDAGRGIFYSSEHNPLHWDIFNYKFTTSVSEDGDGLVWFCSYFRNKGLHYFNPSTGTTSRLPGFDIQSIHRIYNDRHGRLWITTTLPATYVLDKASRRLTTLSTGESGLSYPLWHHMHEDKAGNIWISTANGLSKLPAVQPLESFVPLPAMKNSAGASYSLVNTLQVADSSHIWVCKDDGLYLMDIREKTFRRYAPSRDTMSSANRIFDIQRIDGRWWCGTGWGIQFFDPATGIFTPFTHYAEGHSLAKRSAMWIRKDAEGYLWFASWCTSIYRYNPKTGETIAVNNSRYGDISTTNALFCLRDSRDRLWFGHGANGIRRWNAATEKMVNPLQPSALGDVLSRCIVYNMVEDEVGRFWLSTDRLGAVQMDSNGNVLQCISLKDGLHTTAALYVWLQPGGRLWIATYEGIQTYETSRRLLSAIDLDFGIPVRDYSSVIIGYKDKACVSTNGGLAVLHLQYDATTIGKVPRPLISAVRVFEEDRPVPVADSSLMLRPNENFFSIDFSSQLHRDLPSLQYSYMLEGFDKDWVYCGRRQSAAYTNVPPGHYTFHVRTTNGFGNWEADEALMPIVVAAPYWRSNWFVLLCAGLLLIAGWQIGLYIYRRKRRKRMEQTIDYFANSVYGENSVADICWDISRNCIAQLKLEDCVVYLRDEHKPILRQVAAYGPKSPHGHEIENPIEIEIGKGIVGTVAATGKPVLVSDTRKDPRYIIDDEARLSELAVPIIHDGEVIGVIDTEHSRKGFYKEAHLKALTTIASICSNKIAEAQAEASVRENERELLQIRSMLADSQLMALRTQMNPHFVFNSLNSIQECIVTGKYGEASLYLNKFSKLFRALLENSSKPLIPLSEEIAVLELYLSLEHMRFEGTFEYSIDVDDELEAEEIMIPSMLLQPFVENALWHGLMHKEGERELRLSFEAISSEMFRCTIDDNGIGREKASTLKAARQANGKSHISRGLQITHDRIALMQRRGQKASIRIIDKHDSAGYASGTRVVIELSAYLTSIEA